jgi:hypothetical protein
MNGDSNKKFQEGLKRRECNIEHLLHHGHLSGMHSLIKSMITPEFFSVGQMPVTTGQLGGTSMDEFMQAAIREAKSGLAEGGIPIGAVLVIDGKIIGRGHNRRVQKGSAVFHAEMDCLENAGRLTSDEYRRATLYSPLSPCDMCSGAAMLYKIPGL